MLDLFENHIVGFPTRRLILLTRATEGTNKQTKIFIFYLFSVSDQSLSASELKERRKTKVNMEYFSLTDLIILLLP